MRVRLLVAAALALATVGAAGSAGAATLLVTVTLTELQSPQGVYTDGLWTFKQRVDLGAFVSHPSVTQPIDYYVETTTIGTGSASSGPLAPFLADQAADVGLDDSPLAGSTTLGHTVDDYGGGSEDNSLAGGVTLARQVTGVGNPTHTQLVELVLGGLDSDSLLPAGAPLTQTLLIDHLAAVPTATLTVADFSLPTGFTVFRQYFGTFSFDAAPEPAVWIQLIAGLGLAGAALRRRRAIA